MYEQLYTEIEDLASLHARVQCGHCSLCIRFATQNDQSKITKENIYYKCCSLSPCWSRATTRLAMMLTASVKAEATKNLPGSAITSTPSAAGKCLSRAALTTSAICNRTQMHEKSLFCVLSPYKGTGSYFNIEIEPNFYIV